MTGNSVVRAPRQFRSNTQSFGQIICGEYFHDFSVYLHKWASSWLDTSRYRNQTPGRGSRQLKGRAQKRKRADLMAKNGQFSWPSAGNSVAAYGQLLMAADKGTSWSQTRGRQRTGAIFLRGYFTIALCGSEMKFPTKNLPLRTSLRDKSFL